MARSILKIYENRRLNPWHIQADLFSIDRTPYNLSVGRLDLTLVK